jgi:hypothetical protein
MKAITMTSEQTRAYDDDDTGDVLRAWIRKAQALADETGHLVEIYTADGIVVDARQPQEAT